MSNLFSKLYPFFSVIQSSQTTNNSSIISTKKDIPDRTEFKQNKEPNIIHTSGKNPIYRKNNIQ